MAAFEVIPTGAALGAEIRCGDLRTVDDAAIEAIREVWLNHLVVLFRDQQLTDADLVAWGGRFGEFQYSNPLPSPLANEGRASQGGRQDAHPEITVVSNVVENGVAIGGLGDGELVWHSDMSSFDTPPNQTVLYALEVPAAGGKTSFNNMYAAYETLPGELRERVQHLRLKHDATTDAAGYVRKNLAGSADADLRTSPGAVHPLVRTHPETGRACLYLGRRSKAYFTGLDLDESDTLLDALWTHATLARFAWFHSWRAGDLLMWDNRCVMHRREPFDPNARRILHRVVIKGSKPYGKATLTRESSPEGRRGVQRANAS